MGLFLSEPVQALVAINLLLTISLRFPFAAGVWSLGMSGFMATGAYAAGYCTTELAWAPAPAIAVGALAGVVSTLPVGLLAMRTRGVYLSIATLAEAELIILFFSHFDPTGGVMGMAGTHCLRKTFANNVHKALGGDLFRTSKAMRHSSPLTTLRYLSFKQEEIDRAILAV